MAIAIHNETEAKIAELYEQRRNRTLAQLMEERQTALETETERRQWMDRAKDIIRYCRSDLSEWLDQGNHPKGRSNTNYMYTSRPMTDLEKAADAFVGNLFTDHGWFGAEMADPRLSGKQYVPMLASVVDDLQMWLQACEEHLYGIYSASNFYATMPSLAMDALSLGDGIMYIGNDLDEGLPYFDYRESLGMWWKRDRFGRIIMVHELIQLSAMEAYDRWGNLCNEQVKLDAISNLTATHTFLHAVYKANDPILEGLRFKKAGKRKFIELWIEQGAKENRGHSNPAYEGAVDRMGGVLQQEGYFSMPYVDWPYWLKSGETFGRGPLGSALYTLKRCHAEHRQMMIAGQKAADPPIWATSGMENRIHKGPGEETFGEANELVRELYQRGIQYPFGIDQLDRTENELTGVLQLDLFLMMAMTDKEMKATEVIERTGEKVAALRPRLGLLHRLCLNQSHARVWQIERLNGRLPTPPDVYYELAGMTNERGSPAFNMGIDVRYKGPLSQIQELAFLQRRVQGAFASALPFADLDPQAVRAKVDAARGIEEAFDKAGMSSIIRSDKEFEQIIAANNQAAIEQHAAGVDEQEAAAAYKMAKAEQTARKEEK